MITNAELVRQAKLDLKVSLGQTDWVVLSDDEDFEPRLVRRLTRETIILSYHRRNCNWSARVIGQPFSAEVGPSAPEAYIKLRKVVEFMASMLKDM
ncbi:hypothetical protein [Enterobacter phage EspM4VN]|uniref:Uncharacterized protein n=1 Tax=Enterobacter phage EspM4VN TaxID=2137745 RepID=A0A4P2WVR4_9CAUD|nr:hypothetical protein HYP11_gp121 [Enterobacter phage EspM4VN]BBK03824.1 hypothetical protein [Enterobacter phage EspM4VN]